MNIQIQDDGQSPQETLPIQISDTETLTENKTVGDILIPAGTVIQTNVENTTLKDLMATQSNLMSQISPLQSQLDAVNTKIDAVNGQMTQTLSLRPQVATLVVQADTPIL